MDADWLRLGGAAALSYLIGSLPFSAWLARWRGVDIRTVGSGNPGATNVARSVGVGFGLLALGLDLGKGVAAAALSGQLHAPLVSGLAVIGHDWSPWLRFRGGKGVATTLGVLLMVAPLAALWTVGLWLALTGLSRKVSVGSLGALGAAPLLVWWQSADPALTGLFAVLGAVGLTRHRANLRRLVRGEELPPTASGR